jgi:hypothetical protein
MLGRGEVCDQQPGPSEKFRRTEGKACAAWPMFFCAVTVSLPSRALRGGSELPVCAQLHHVI